MTTGRIISVDSRGRIRVESGNSIVGAQVMSGGVHIGGQVHGQMEAGIQAWLCSDRRVIVVNVHPKVVPVIDRYAAAA